MNKYNKKLKVIFLGNWGYGNAGLKALINISNIDVYNVFSMFDLNNKDKYLNQVYFTSIENNIPIINSSKSVLNKSDFEDLIKNNNDVDFIISCCFDRILSQSVIDYPSILSINIHPSLLPKFRGIKPLENAIINGDRKTGITIHELTKNLDSGSILIQTRSIDINSFDTYKNLYNLQCDSINNILRKFFNNFDKYILNKKEQNENDSSYAPRLKFPISDDDTVSEIIKKNKNKTKK